MRARIVALVGFLILLALLYLWWGDQGPPVIAEAPTVQGSAEGSPVPRPHPPTETAPTPVERTTCAANRAVLVHRRARQTRECESYLLGQGCLGPLPFPDLAPTPAVVEDATRKMLDDCGLEAARAVFDCSEYPCLLLLPQGDSLAAAECFGTVEEAPELHSSLGLALTGALFYRPPPPSTLERVEHRETFRLDRLNRATRFPPVVLDDVDLLSCEEVDKGVAESTDCATVAARRGCKEPDPEWLIPESLVEEYLDDVHSRLQELAERCEKFDQSSWFLDCESLPCVLGVDRDELDSRGGLVGYLCGDQSLHGVQFTTRGATGSRVTLLPLLKLGPDEVVEANRLRWAEERDYRLMFVSKYLGSPAAKAVPSRPEP